MENQHGYVENSSEPLSPNYILGKKLGNGSFGKVRVATHTMTGKKVAVKILDLLKLSETDAERVRREIQLLGSFQHPHIVRLFEVIEKKSKIYLVMEYMDGRELYYYVVERGRLPENEARYLFQQIISGVEFCHYNRVAHRDLKPENLLMDCQGNVKIADFGLSNVMRDGHFLKTSCGSPNYAAPEIIGCKHYCGPEVDVWSCGVILYVLLCGTLPFDAENIPTLFRRIKEGVYTLPSHLSSGARDLIYQILMVDPMKRIDILRIREHPWFQSHLPRRLVASPEEIKSRANQIDYDILREVVDIGLDHKSVITSLLNKEQNQETVTYYLLLDKQSHFCTNQLDSSLKENTEYGISKTYQKENNLFTTKDSLWEQSSTCKTSARLQPSGAGNWALGLESRSRPNDIMRVVFTMLRKLNVDWKAIGCYNFKCRWLPIPNSLPRLKDRDVDLSTAPSVECAGYNAGGVVLTSQNTIKFEIQLYKSSSTSSILDLQLLSGPPMLFLELCHSFLTQLIAK